MEAFSKLKVDLSQIPGPHRIQGLFLLVLESLLGFWLFKAESINERVFAGSIMGLIFIIFSLKVMTAGSSFKHVIEPNVSKKYEELITDLLKDKNSYKTLLENDITERKHTIESLRNEKRQCEKEREKMRTVINIELEDEIREKLYERGILKYD
jgi:hypothetical protein